jgi:hypothetical protein
MVFKGIIVSRGSGKASGKEISFQNVFHNLMMNFCGMYELMLNI